MASRLVGSSVRAAAPVCRCQLAPRPAQPQSRRHFSATSSSNDQLVSSSSAAETAPAPPPLATRVLPGKKQKLARRAEVRQATKARKAALDLKEKELADLKRELSLQRWELEKAQEWIKEKGKARASFDPTPRAKEVDLLKVDMADLRRQQKAAAARQHEVQPEQSIELTLGPGSLSRFARDSPPHRERSASADPSSYAFRLSSSSVQPQKLNPLRRQPPVARLAPELERALFNPGVHWVQDPRSGVFNFPPRMANLPPIQEFDFSLLPAFTSPSKDENLRKMAANSKRPFYGSTSSLTGLLSQVYFWISRFQPVNLSSLSQKWQEEPRTFTMGAQLPQAVMLNYDAETGTYGVDQDKSTDKAGTVNVLLEYGNFLEKYLTTSEAEFARFMQGAKDPAPSEAVLPQAYYYSASERMVMRSQLDATSPHLPRQTFDVKTRGVVSVRHDRLNWEKGAGYVIRSQRGKFESFEREYYDLIRGAFLKYQFQARIGNMDGVVVAYHNTRSVFGLHYVATEEMDEALFGSKEQGDQAFKLCIGFVERILDKAVEIYPKQDVRVMFQAATAKHRSDYLRVFVHAVKPQPEGKAAVTMLRVEGINLVDGVPVAADLSVDLVAMAQAKAKEGSDAAPEWEVAYDMTVHDGREGGLSYEAVVAQATKADNARKQLGDLMLPPGVGLKDLKHFDGPAAAGAEDGEFELEEPSSVDGDLVEVVAPRPFAVTDEGKPDWPVRFPYIEGIRYTTRTTSMVRVLRAMSDKGREWTEEREKTKGEKEKVVSVRSRVVM